MRHPRALRRDGERGSLTLMLAVLLVALLSLAGLVIDGGRQAEPVGERDGRRAGGGAGRRWHGGQADRVRSAGRSQVDQAQALAAAREYLANAGYHGSARRMGTSRSRSRSP